MCPCTFPQAMAVARPGLTRIQGFGRYSRYVLGVSQLILLYTQLWWSAGHYCATAITKPRRHGLHAHLLLDLLRVGYCRCQVSVDRLVRGKDVVGRAVLGLLSAR